MFEDEIITRTARLRTEYKTNNFVPIVYHRFYLSNHFLTNSESKSKNGNQKFGIQGKI